MIKRKSIASKHLSLLVLVCDVINLSFLITSRRYENTALARHRQHSTAYAKFRRTGVFNVKDIRINNKKSLLDTYCSWLLTFPSSSSSSTSSSSFFIDVSSLLS